MNTRPKHRLHLELTFATVEKMLYKLAWDNARRYGLDFHEALSECFDAFMRAFYRRYDEGRGMEFSTFLTFLVTCRFRTLARKKRLRGEDVTQELDEELVGTCPEAESPALEAVAGMSEAAQEFVQVLLSPMEDWLDGYVPTPNRLLGHAKRHFRRKGWSRSRVKSVVEELQIGLRMQWAS